MPFDRYYIDASFEKNQKVKIADQEFNHLKKVMRKKEKDIVEIINGKGYLAKAEIISINSKSAQAEIISIKKENEKQEKLTLIQSIIKLNRLEFILEKACELGCDEFWLFNSQNSEKINLSESKLKRFNNILISAIKQSGRLFIPKIKFFSSITSIPEITGSIFYGDTKKTRSSVSLKKENIFFVIGPEKGFSKDELAFLKKIKAEGLWLNNNILRSETAAIAAVSIISYFQ